MQFFVIVTQLAGVSEYTNYIYADGLDSRKVCSGYDTKQSDGEASVILEFLGNAEYSFIAIDPKLILAWIGWYWLGIIYGSNRTNLCNYAKPNCLKLTIFISV